MRALILGGTAEARVLAQALEETGVSAVTSLAGRTAEPRVPGETRIGGFGGAEGLVRYLRAERIDAIVDATHPFAATMPATAVAVAERTATPLLRLRRPGWRERPGDRWHRVPSIAAAVAALEHLGARALVTTGRGDLAAFMKTAAWLLIRTITPPPPPLPPHHRLIVARGPFTLTGELALIDRHGIDLIVTKDSGGDATAAKLHAARERGLPVLMIDRPPTPHAPTVSTPQAALQWVTDGGFPTSAPRARLQ